MQLFAVSSRQETSFFYFTLYFVCFICFNRENELFVQTELIGKVVCGIRFRLFRSVKL